MTHRCAECGEYGVGEVLFSRQRGETVLCTGDSDEEVIDAGGEDTFCSRKCLVTSLIKWHMALHMHPLATLDHLVKEHGVQEVEINHLRPVFADLAHKK